MPGFMLPVLRGLAIILALVVGLELLLPYDGSIAPAGPPASQKAKPAASAVSIATSVTPELLQVMAQRPLFDPTRKAQAKPVADHSGPSQDLTELPRLSGLMVAGEARFAVFQPTGQDAKPLVVPVGGEIAGYNVVSIEPQGVVVDGPSGQETLRPRLDPNAVPAEPAMPPNRSQQPTNRPQPGPQAAANQPARPNAPPGTPGFNPRRMLPPNLVRPPFQPGGPQQASPRPVFPQNQSTRGDD